MITSLIFAICFFNLLYFPLSLCWFLGHRYVWVCVYFVVVVYAHMLPTFQSLGSVKPLFVYSISISICFMFVSLLGVIAAFAVVVIAAGISFHYFSD